MALHRTLRGHLQGASGLAGKAAFARELGIALRRLYDPVALRHSQLLAFFDLQDRQDPLDALRRLLVEAIEALKPPPGTPPQASAWRIYQILYERYVEQFSQDEVAVHLAVGTRQLRRQESLARRILVDYLWDHHGPGRASRTEPSASGSTTAVASLATPSREQELEWLKRSHPMERASIAEVIQPVLRAIAPLLQALGTGIECTLPDSLPRPLVQLTTLRQALSNVITAAVHSTPGGWVGIAAQVRGQEIVIEVRAGAGAAHQRGTHPTTQDDLDNLQLAQTMVGFSGGSLDVVPEAFSARLALPVVGEVTVLVVDDNADTLRLLERYLAGTRYRFTGTADPEQVLAKVAELSPQVIVIDVMLPGVDGWELLGRLREHPKTCGVPIIVCTILAQEQLALTLGAAAFLRKPVGREMFLRVLDQVAPVP